MNRAHLSIMDNAFPFSHFGRSECVRAGGYWTLYCIVKVSMRPSSEEGSQHIKWTIWLAIQLFIELHDLAFSFSQFTHFGIHVIVGKAHAWIYRPNKQNSIGKEWETIHDNQAAFFQCWVGSSTFASFRLFDDELKKLLVINCVNGSNSINTIRWI